MSREDGMEKEFSRNVDRLLAGEKVEAPAGRSEDYRTALDFARRMISLKGSPSPVFSARLKERLLRQLRERERRAVEEQRSNWLVEGLRHLTPQSPVWRTVAVALVIVLMVGTALWRMGGTFAPVAPAPAQAPAAPSAAEKRAPERAGAPAPALAPAPAPVPAPAPAPRPGFVLPPQGVPDKTIEVNESHTAKGITVTLQRVELSAAGMRVYAFNTLSGYPLPQGATLPPVVMIRAHARFSIDGGDVKDAGDTLVSSDPGGTVPAWDNLEPVPKGARQLTFVITSLGDLEGPWTFVVGLT